VTRSPANDQAVDKKTAVVAGATGLVGKELVRQLCENPAYGSVIALSRRSNSSPMAESSGKLKIALLPTGEDILTGDEFYCALGTTIKIARSQAAFRAVDYDLVLDLVKRAQKGAIPRVAVISSVGSDANSRVFYSRVKGEMERDLKALHLPQLDIYQPSFLVGHRREFRIGEIIGMKLAGLIAPLMTGKLAKYAPIQASELARKMIAGEPI
jgi:uncharacterized protein YbjT (DUF2867 family)